MKSCDIICQITRANVYNSLNKTETNRSEILCDDKTQWRLINQLCLFKKRHTVNDSYSVI